MYSYYSTYSQTGIFAILRKCSWPAKAAGPASPIPSNVGPILRRAQGARVFAAEDGDPKRITKLVGTRAWPCSSWHRCGTELTVRAAVREVSENWWYGDVFPVEYGKWGDRKPLCFPDVKPFQKIIYVDRGPVQWTDDRWPSEPRVVNACWRRLSGDRRLESSKGNANGPPVAVPIPGCGSAFSC